jgi:hypothetical protein
VHLGEVSEPGRFGQHVRISVDPGDLLKQWRQQ